MKKEEKDDLLKINLFKLEIEAAGQARLLREWSDKLARAERDAKLAKRKLRVTKAELNKVVRSAPSKYGIVGKPTETMVEDVIVCMTKYKEDEAAQFEAEYNRDLIKAMVMSLHERGEQIGNEVKLHGQQYWARPKVDPETKQRIDEYSREEVMRQSSEALNQKPNRK